MIYSMTGYGQAEGRIAGVDYAVEIRTVNNRYLRTTLKMPEALTFLEEHIEKLLRQQLQRGTVNFALRVRGVADNSIVDIDESVLVQLVTLLDRCRTGAGVEATVDMASLLSVPGVVRAQEPTDALIDQIKGGVLDLTRQALDGLKAMRGEEGRHLYDDLAGHCDVIRQALPKIKARRSTVLEDQAERLRKRVDTLLAEAKLKLDEETLAREVAVLADRSDIAEELARLESHVCQFLQACETDGDQVGRRLDFIAQEMLREANTIGSKSSDSEIAELTVDIKCRVDRIKEQIQNVE
ncbi:YicC/YloC family endoribonuclease [Planctomycetota bacterium]